MAERSKTSSTELDELVDQSKQLTREIERLAEAVASTGVSVPALAKKLAERQHRLDHVTARLTLLRTAPEVLSLEVRRIEAEVRKRIIGFRDLLARDETEARKVVASLLAGPLTFTPVHTPAGRRYQVEGRVTTGALLRVDPAEILPTLSAGSTAKHPASGREASRDPQYLRPQGDSNEGGSANLRQFAKLDRSRLLQVRAIV